MHRGHIFHTRWRESKMGKTSILTCILLTGGQLPTHLQSYEINKHLFQNTITPLSNSLPEMHLLPIPSPINTTQVLHILTRAGSSEASSTFGHAKCKFFSVYKPYKEPISKAMSDNNDLNLHSMTKLSGWLRY